MSAARRRRLSLAPAWTAYHVQRPSSVLVPTGAVRFQDTFATLLQIRDVAQPPRVRQSETELPYDRYEPVLVSSFQAGERHVPPGAPLCSALTPDSLQIVPGLL